MNTVVQIFSAREVWNALAFRAHQAQTLGLRLTGWVLTEDEFLTMTGDRCFEPHVYGRILLAPTPLSPELPLRRIIASRA